MRKVSIITAIVMALTLMTASVALAGPTCSDTLGVKNHAEHALGDYVREPGASNARGGAVLPGGPGPGFHFPEGFAPASIKMGSPFLKNSTNLSAERLQKVASIKVASSLRSPLGPLKLLLLAIVTSHTGTLAEVCRIIGSRTKRPVSITLLRLNMAGL